MPKYSIVTLTRETGILGTLTRLKFPDDSDRIRLSGMVSSAVNGSAKIIDVRWGESTRLFGYDEIYISLEVSSRMGENDVKSATISAIRSFWGNAPVEVYIKDFRVLSLLDETVSGVLDEPFFKYLVVGFSSGIVIGLIAFGLFRVLGR